MADEEKDETILEGWMKKELDEARKRMEKDGYPPKEIIRRLKLLKAELTGQNPGASTYVKPKIMTKEMLDAASDY